MALFSRKKEEIREDQAIEADTESVSDPLLQALIGTDYISRDTVMNIPAISSCVNKISDTIASLNVKLYRRSGDTIEEITDDYRLRLLNEDTGDTLDAFQFKKAMIEDMYLDKGGYAFINKKSGKIKSIHYVKAESISFFTGSDPIFKDYQICVNGSTYEPYQFIKLLRNTRKGWRGRSIVEESPVLMSVLYNSQKYEETLVKTGGNKKGFLQATQKVSKEAMDKLKEAFRRLYSNGTDNVIVLNDGLTFKESANTSVELQLNENKKTNNNDICKIFLIPPTIINGGASEEDKKTFYEQCILPRLKQFDTAINRVLLTESEKENMFFAFDDSDLVKGDIEKRFKAYEIASKNGFMQTDEIRRKEKLPALELDFIKLGLQDVLFFPKTGKIYTPNTDKFSDMSEDQSEDLDQESESNIEDEESPLIQTPPDENGGGEE